MAMVGAVLFLVSVLGLVLFLTSMSDRKTDTVLRIRLTVKTLYPT